MPHQSYEGDICDGLSGRYGGGFPGFSSPFGLGQCGVGRWLGAGVLGLGAIAGTAFAVTGNNEGSPYDQQQYEWQYEYRIPDLSGDFELPEGFELEFPQ